MLESFSAIGFLVHTPWGPRKSGMPESVEIPAPVRATTERAAAIHWRMVATRASTGAGSRDMPPILPHEQALAASMLLHSTVRDDGPRNERESLERPRDRVG